MKFTSCDVTAAIPVELHSSSIGSRNGPTPQIPNWIKGWTLTGLLQTCFGLSNPVYLWDVCLMSSSCHPSIWCVLQPFNSFFVSKKQQCRYKYVKPQLSQSKHGKL
ncbi:hypothetical protein ILYODFUR_003681 [Ilyodon furcidens]|uniref:Uncharacterized protein n=1 Tax=Ilyodon furcidens TaxID=33524 RepID=A0ABV0SX40_9TELE